LRLAEHSCAPPTHVCKTSIIGSTPIAASIHSFAQATLYAEPAAASRRLFRLVSACAPGATPQLTCKVGVPVTARPGCRVGTEPARRDKRLLSAMSRPLVMS